MWHLLCHCYLTPERNTYRVQALGWLEKKKKMNNSEFLTVSATHYPAVLLVVTSISLHVEIINV